MALYLNEYTCPSCSHEWEDHWDSGCNDTCPECGLREITPVNSTKVSEGDSE